MVAYSARCLPSLPHFHQTDGAVERWTPSRGTQPGLVLGLIPSILGKDVAGIVMHSRCCLSCACLQRALIVSCRSNPFGEALRKTSKGSYPKPVESESG